MFIYTLKASTIKLAALSIFSVLLIASLIIFMPMDNTVPAEATVVSETDKEIKYPKIKTADDMNSFIKSLGWEVEKNPIEIVEVNIPKEFNNVYLKYNELQRSQNLNLEKYKGKIAKRYTYIVTNYPNTNETVYLNIIIYKNKIIAGDICSADVNGFVHGLSSENAQNK